MELLAYLVIGMPYLVAAALGLALPALLLGAYNRFGVGLAIIAVAWMGELLMMSRPMLRIGLTIYTADLPMVLVAIAASLRWLLRDDVPRRHPAWLLVVLVFGVGLLWGLAKNGTAAGVQSRPEFNALAAASYVMSFPMDGARVRLALRSLVLLGVGVMLLCLYRWIVYYAPIPDLLPPGGVYNVDGAIRVVPSYAALLLAQMAVLGLFFGTRALGLLSARLLVPLLLGVTLVLQHRSVWLAGIVAFLLSLMLSRARKAPLWQQGLLAVAVVSATAAPLAFNSFISGQLQSSAQRALAGQGTVAERFQNWRATLQQWADDGPVAIAVGRVRGSDTRRVVDDERGNERQIDYNAHNHYVNSLSANGVIGFAGYLWMLGYAVLGLLRSVRRFDDDSPLAAVLLVLVGAQLAYFVAYGVDFIQYTVLGIAIAWVAQRARERIAAKPAAPQVRRPVVLGAR